MTSTLVEALKMLAALYEHHVIDEDEVVDLADGFIKQHQLGLPITLPSEFFHPLWSVCWCWQHHEQLPREIL